MTPIDPKRVRNYQRYDCYDLINFGLAWCLLVWISPLFTFMWKHNSAGIQILPNFESSNPTLPPRASRPSLETVELARELSESIIWSFP